MLVGELGDHDGEHPLVRENASFQIRVLSSHGPSVLRSTRLAARSRPAGPTENARPGRPFVRQVDDLCFAGFVAIAAISEPRQITGKAEQLGEYDLRMDPF